MLLLIHKNSLCIKAAISVTVSKRKQKNQINHYDKDESDKDTKENEVSIISITFFILLEHSRAGNIMPIVQTMQKSNLSKILCLSGLSASLMKIQ